MAVTETLESSDACSNYQGILLRYNANLTIDVYGLGTEIIIDYFGIFR